MDDRKSIIIADSSWENRLILGEILKKDFRIFEADNAEHAINLLYREMGNIALILLDAVSPSMQCIKIMRLIRLTPELPNTPVILLTSSMPSDQENAAINEGAWDFISAPYNVVAVEERVKNVISRSLVKDLEKKQIELEEKANVMMNSNLNSGIDPITGFLTKNVFIYQCNERIENQSGLCLCAFRIENFHRFIDTKGELTSDKVRSLFARFLQEALPPKTIYGKLDEDVFVALCSCDINYESIEHFINGRISDAHMQYHDDPSGYARMAVTEVDGDAPFAEILEKTILSANEAADNNSKRLIVLNKREIEKQIEYEHNLESQLDGLFERNEFELLFTPVFNYSAKKIVAMEINCKWKNPLLGHIRARDYLPVFKKYGLVSKLDAYIWDKAISWQSTLKERQIPSVRVILYLRREDLAFVEIADLLDGLCKKHGVKPSDVTIMYKNFALSEAPILLSQLAESLKEKGFGLGLDDLFGFNAFDTLSRFNFDTVGLKMDLNALKTDNDKPKKYQAALFLLMKIISTQTVAFHVDTEDQALMLYRAGCEYMSGKFYTKKTDTANAERLLIEHGILDYVYNSASAQAELFPHNYQSFINNKLIGAADLFEIKDGAINSIMANDEMKHICGVERNRTAESFKMTELIDAEQQNALSQRIIETCKGDNLFVGIIPIKAIGEPGKTRHLKFRIANVWNIGDSHMYIGVCEDVSNTTFLLEKMRAQTEKYARFMKMSSKITLEYDVIKDCCVVSDYEDGLPSSQIIDSFHSKYTALKRLNEDGKEMMWNVISYAAHFKTNGNIMLKADVEGYGDYVDFIVEYESISDADGKIIKVLALGQVT